MAKRYYKLLTKIAQKEPFLMTKLSLLNELAITFDCEIDDETLNKIFDRYFCDWRNITHFVKAIYFWCNENGTTFDKVENYDTMLNAIF